MPASDRGDARGYADTGEWISDAEVAKIPYTAFASTKDRTTARLIVQRVKDARYPDALFSVWPYRPFSPIAPNRPQTLTSPTATMRSATPPSAMVF